MSLLCSPAFVCIIKTFWMSKMYWTQWLKMHFWKAALFFGFVMYKILGGAYTDTAAHQGFDFAYLLTYLHTCVRHVQKEKLTVSRESRWKAELGVCLSVAGKHTEGAISSITCPMISE